MLDLLGFKPLKPRSGPICSGLDRILDKHGITPQVYHSRSFIGNHCHKYASTPAVYEELTSYILEKTRSCTKFDELRSAANFLKNKFNMLNSAYMPVHNAVSHSLPINKTEVPHIQEDIEKYFKYFKTRFPEINVIPKQHFLEKHCTPWIAKYGFSLGFHGEQGGELIHATIAKLERRARAIRNPETRLRTIMKMHHLQVSPTLMAYVPQVKRRHRSMKIVD